MSTPYGVTMLHEKEAKEKKGKKKKTTTNGKTRSMTRTTFKEGMVGKAEKALRGRKKQLDERM